MPYPLLAITDGIIRISLLAGSDAGLHLADWKPQPPQAKGGGVWQDGQLSDGRRLAVKKWSNVTDTFVISANQVGQNSLIYIMQDLRRLLEKAASYWTTDWQGEPVWIEAVASCETNPRYAIIHDYQLSGESSPYAKPFAGGISAAFGELTLALEHGPWLGQLPGTGTCVRDANYETGYNIGPWAVNSALPASTVIAVFQTSTGRLLACDGTVTWWTDDGGATAWTTSAAVGWPTYCFAQGGANIYLAGATHVDRSTDNGATWGNRNAVYGGYGNCLFYRAVDRYLYLLDDTNKKIYRSIDEAATWALCSGALTNIYALVVLPNGELYVGTKASGVWKSVDGTNWVMLTSLFVGTPMRLFCPGDGYLYMETWDWIVSQYKMFRISPVAGSNWEQITNPDTVNNTSHMLYSSQGVLYLSKAVTGVIYASLAGGGLWKTEATFGAFAGNMAETTLPAATAKNRMYCGADGNIWAAGATITANIGQTATCDDAVFAPNHEHVGQLTHIFKWDAAPTWTSVFPAAAFPFDLFQAAPINGDIIYFGIQSTAGVPLAGPFNNLVFQIGTRFIYPAIGIGAPAVLAWEVWTGAAWAALTVRDGTNEFTNVGAQSVHWAPPTNWVTVAVNGVTGWWVRARITGIVGDPAATSSATQDIHDVYTANHNAISIAAADVLGDLPALLRVILNQRADKDGANAPAAWDNRIVVGLRSDSRGALFRPFINLSDVQLPLGLTISVVGATTAAAAYVPAPTGRIWIHTGTGASTWSTPVILSLYGPLAASYYGTFRIFLRAWQTAGASGDVRFRLRVRGSAGAVYATGEYAVFATANNWQILDLGSFRLPGYSTLSPSDITDFLSLQLQAWSSAARDVYLYDLVFIPTDEWSCDSLDGAQVSGSSIMQGYQFDLDSVTFPKYERRSLVRANGSLTGLVRSMYTSISAGPAALQAGVAQHLYTLASRYDGVSFSSEPWACHSARLQAAYRYLLMRGSR